MLKIDTEINTFLGFRPSSHIIAKNFVKINSTTSKIIVTFADRIDQLSHSKNLKEFRVRPKFEWLVLTRTAS